MSADNRIVRTTRTRRPSHNCSSRSSMRPHRVAHALAPVCSERLLAEHSAKEQQGCQEKERHPGAAGRLSGGCPLGDYSILAGIFAPDRRVVPQLALQRGSPIDLLSGRRPGCRNSGSQPVAMPGSGAWVGHNLTDPGSSANRCPGHGGCTGEAVPRDPACDGGRTVTRRSA